jgi:hypothetical protein
VTRRLRFLGCTLLLLWSAACSSTPAEPEENAGPSGGAAGDSGASGSSGSGFVRCPEGTNPKSAPNPVQLGTVSGQIVDENGAPTSAGLVQVCGKDICINARVGDDGVLAQSVDQLLEDPACKFGDGLTWAKLAVPVVAGDNALGTLATVRLPDFADAAALRPGEAASSGGVTLTLDPSAHVNVDGLTYVDESQQGFRAVALPDRALTQLNQDFVAAYALSPVETRICPSPSLSIENAAQLAPGAGLELYILGFDVAEPWAPYGAWQKVGDGQVSDDGKTLEFPDGLPLLTAIGIKEKG